MNLDFSLDPVFYPDEKDFEKIDHFSIGKLLFLNVEI